MIKKPANKIIKKAITKKPTPKAPLKTTKAKKTASHKAPAKPKTVTVKGKQIKLTFKQLNPELYDPKEMKRLRDILIFKFGNYCFKCKSKTRIVLEHIKSRAKGGTNDLSNLQLLCSHCNLQKGHKEIDYRPF